MATNNGSFSDEVSTARRVIGRLKDEVTEMSNRAYSDDNSTALVDAYTAVLSSLERFAGSETLAGNGSSTWEADDEVITEADHGLKVGDYVRVAIASGATGASSGFFYVKTVPSSSTFTLSTTDGGATQAISADGVVNVYKIDGPGVDLARAALAHLQALVSEGALELLLASISYEPSE